MAFKPNYNQQRAERDRAKEQKKKEKLLRQEEEVARRKGQLDDEANGETSADVPRDDNDGSGDITTGPSTGPASGDTPPDRS